MSSGCGWPWMQKLVKSWGSTLGIAVARSAKGLWASLPAVYRQCAVIYTDRLSAYLKALPSKRQRAVDKDSGYTSYIERFNNTLRQRVSRLVRKTLSFSRKLENHIAAIWNFVHHYNEQLRIKQEHRASFSPSFP